MRLATKKGGGVGVVEDEQFAELSEVHGSPATMLELIETAEREGTGFLEDLRRRAPRRALSDIELDAPLERPGAIVAAPVNYVDHMAEMSEVRDIRSLGVFLKARSSVIGPGGTIRLPYLDRRFDHEGELGVVIAKTLTNVSEQEAMASVFGYTCLLDITMRGGEDRSTRKSFHGFTPIGPYIVTPEEVGDASDLRLTCAVNGAIRQDACTSDLVWDVARLIAYTSSVMTLYPGDVIATGTPAGVGPIEDGDIIEVSIERVGRLCVEVSNKGALPCPTLGAGSGPVPPPPPVGLPLPL